MEQEKIINNKLTSGLNKEKCPYCGSDKGFEAGIVLDPFCGSGTTLLVAKKLNRNFIGIDINPDYCALAEKRLSQYAFQKKLI